MSFLGHSEFGSYRGQGWSLASGPSIFFLWTSIESTQRFKEQSVTLCPYQCLEHSCVCSFVYSLSQDSVCHVKCHIPCLKQCLPSLRCESHNIKYHFLLSQCKCYIFLLRLFHIYIHQAPESSTIWVLREFCPPWFLCKSELSSAPTPEGSHHSEFCRVIYTHLSSLWWEMMCHDWLVILCRWLTLFVLHMCKNEGASWCCWNKSEMTGHTTWHQNNLSFSLFSLT